MQKAIAVCIEREAGPTTERFIRCTARYGREAGLAIGLGGEILWCSSEPAACELWVTGDNKLVAVRAAPDDWVRLERGSRGLDMPRGRAVVVLNQDTIVVNGLRFCVHVHGPTDTVHPPLPLRVGRGMAVVAAMSVALGCTDEVSVVSRPVGVGVVAASGGSAAVVSGAGAQPAGGSTSVGTAAAGTAGTGGTIEIVDFPPIIE